MCLVQPLPSGQHCSRWGGWWELPNDAHDQGLLLQWQELLDMQKSLLLFQGQLTAGHAWQAIPWCCLSVTLLGCWGEAGVVEEHRASRKLGVQAWAPCCGDRAWGVSVLGRPCHPDCLGRMLSPGSTTLPVCTPHSPLLPALEITPSLCFCWCTPVLAARLPSAGPSLDKWVLGPRLHRRGQPSWQGAPCASAPGSA